MSPTWPAFAQRSESRPKAGPPISTSAPDARKRVVRAAEPLIWRPMARFSVRFLGCKVSHTDARAVRERLLADGHTEVADGGDVAVVNTCCVTHEAVSKSRQAASRAARTHARVYVTGCGANLAGALEGLPENVSVLAKPSEDTPAAVAGAVGAIGCVQADNRLDRVPAF